ncbi:MAG: hypothetical protein RBT11_08950 [Desulfobacterales bacterium]|jgi:hypothetical protein|nr:hypothetical protein [Desulfobacterales bacterium]
MSEPTKKLTRVCKCENCGNEAEMVVTCSLEDAGTSHEHRGKKAPPSEKPADGKVKGTATCTHCGNEADMWIDL